MPLSVESTSYNLGAWARARENDCSITGLGLATTLRFLRFLRFHGIASMQPSFQQCRPVARQPIGRSQVALTARSFSGVTCSHPAPPLQHLFDDSTVLIATRRRAECIGGSISAKSLVVRSVDPLCVCNLRAAEEVGTLYSRLRFRPLPNSVRYRREVTRYNLSSSCGCILNILIV